MAVNKLSNAESNAITRRLIGRYDVIIFSVNFNALPTLETQNVFKAMKFKIRLEGFERFFGKFRIGSLLFRIRCTFRNRKYTHTMCTKDVIHLLDERSALFTPRRFWFFFLFVSQTNMAG